MFSGGRMELPGPSQSSCGEDLPCSPQWQGLAIVCSVSVALVMSGKFQRAHRVQAYVGDESALSGEGLRGSMDAAMHGTVSFFLQGPK